MAAAARKLSILVVSWNGREHLETCLPAVQAQRDPGCPWELLLLDNGSRDGTAAWVRARHPWVRLIESPTNLGFAEANNRLAALAEGSPGIGVYVVDGDIVPGAHQPFGDIAPHPA